MTKFRHSCLSSIALWMVAIRTTTIMHGGSPFFQRVSAFATHLFPVSGPQQHNVVVRTFANRGGGAGAEASGETSSAVTQPTQAQTAVSNKLVQDAMNIFDASSVTPRVFAGIPYWDTSTTNQFRVFFVLGGPGAGKGSQCELLTDQYPCIHFSVGELLRNVPPESPHASLIEETLVAGNIVPVEISLSLLKAAMEQQRTRSVFYLVDGFPRNYDNLEGWCRVMSSESVASVWGVLMFQCPFVELERRILSRAETSGRSDDNVASAKRRFVTFERETVPVVNILRQVEARTKGNLSLRVMDVAGDQPLEKVWDDVQCSMNQFVLHDVVTANAQLVRAVEEGKCDLYKSLVAWRDEDDDDETVDSQDAMNFMTNHEGPIGKVKVSNGLIDFVEGKKVVVSYDRVLSDRQSVRESRVWSHEGERGWVNIHFSRTPL